jgi:hypothetical protein
MSLIVSHHNELHMGRLCIKLGNALAYCGPHSMVKKTSCIKLSTVLAGCQKKPNLQRHQGGDHLTRQTRKTRFDVGLDLATLGHFDPLWATLGYVFWNFWPIFLQSFGPLFCQFLKITKLYNKTFAVVINSVLQ